MHCVSLGEVLLYAHQFLPMLLFPEYICYDDGCHVNKFCTNPIRKDLTGTTKKLALLPIMVDKMHITGHVDAWCLENCDSRKVKDLEKVRAPFTSICTLNKEYMYNFHVQVDTQICEQTFSWLSRYAKITRKTNQEH